MYRRGDDVVLQRCEAARERVARAERRLKPAHVRHLGRTLRAELALLHRAIDQAQPTTIAGALALEELLDRLEEQLDLASDVGARLYAASTRSMQRFAAALALLGAGGALVVYAHVSAELPVPLPPDVRGSAAFGSTMCNDPQVCAVDPRCVRVDELLCRVRTGADCRTSRECSVHGACSARLGVCRAVSNLDCERSALCTYGGRCLPDRSGECVAARGDDCGRATVCREHGRCTARGGACVEGDQLFQPRPSRADDETAWRVWSLARH